MFSLGFILFVALGVWQIERRGEKLALIAAVEERVHAPPVAAPGPERWLRVGFEGDAYRAVRARGTFLHDSETLVRAATDRGPGYWVMTPMRTDEGWTLLVNRGFVPPESRSRSGRRSGEPAGPVTVTGLLRITETGGSFLHSNDPERDLWYSRDVAAIGRTRRLGAIAPYFIDAGETPAVAGQPIGGLTVVHFPNNHLQYAITWFALAGLAAFGLFALRRERLRAASA